MNVLAWSCLVILVFEIIMRIGNSKIEGGERIVGVLLNIPVIVYIILTLFF